MRMTAMVKNKKRTRKKCISFPLESLFGSHGDINAHVISLGQPGQYIGDIDKILCLRVVENSLYFFKFKAKGWENSVK